MRQNCFSIFSLYIDNRTKANRLSAWGRLRVNTIYQTSIFVTFLHCGNTALKNSGITMCEELLKYSRWLEWSVSTLILKQIIADLNQKTSYYEVFKNNFQFCTCGFLPEWAHWQRQPGKHLQRWLRKQNWTLDWIFEIFKIFEEIIELWVW